MILKLEQVKNQKGGRRLYTDENPKDTVKINSQLHLTQEQQLQRLKRSINLMQEKFKFDSGEQRAKVMGKTQVASIFKKGKEQIRKKRGTKTG